MKRKRSQSTVKRDLQLLSMIEPVKTYHPLWGYRRIWSYLKYRQGYSVGINRVYRVMKEHGMLVTPQVRRRAKRGPIRPKPVASRPNQFWGIDMTKIKIAPWGWLYLCLVLDWYTKEIVGYSLSLQSKTDDWLDALEMAVNNRFPQGIREPREKMWDGESTPLPNCFLYFNLSNSALSGPSFSNGVNLSKNNNYF